MNKLILIADNLSPKKYFFPVPESSKQLIMSQFHTVLGGFQFRFNVPSKVLLRYLILIPLYSVPVQLYARLPNRHVYLEKQPRNIFGQVADGQK